MLDLEENRRQAEERVLAQAESARDSLLAPALYALAGGGARWPMIGHPAWGAGHAVVYGSLQGMIPGARGLRRRRLS